MSCSSSAATMMPMLSSSEVNCHQLHALENNNNAAANMCSADAFHEASGTFLNTQLTLPTKHNRKS